MKQRFLSFVSVAILFLVLVVSCSKGGDTPDPNPPGPQPPPPPPDPGTISLSIPEPRENPLTFSYFSDTKTVDIFSISRTGSNTTATNTAVTAKVVKMNELIDMYNLDKGTNLEPIPDSLYTTAVTNTGDTCTLNLASGETSKKFTISINGAKWDISHEYAMAFILTVPEGGNITGKDTIITVLSVKNKWDGVYKVTGTFSDVISPFTANYPYEWELRTVNATQCVVWDNVYLNAPGFLYNTGTGTAVSSYASFGLLVSFDPATDKIISVVNYYGQPASNSRSASLDDTGTNSYNAATKTVSIKYVMKQPSAVPTPPNIRANFNEQWEFQRSR